jgi:hypothetical protein
VIRQVFHRLDSPKLLTSFVSHYTSLVKSHKFTNIVNLLDPESELLCSGDVNYRMAAALMIAEELRLEVRKGEVGLCDRIFGWVLGVAL